MIRPHHWLIALLIAAGAHLITFAVLAYSKPIGDAADAGQQGIEIDLGMLGDLGEAQETEQPEEIAPPAPQVAPPPPPPPPPAPPRQQAVAQVKTPPKPKPEPEPVREPVQEEQQPNSAPETVETGQSQTDTSQRKQTTGTGNAATAGGVSSATKSYHSMLASKLARYKRYPSASRRRNEQGTPVLHFVVARDGSVSQASIRTSSGFQRLDDAVLDMLKRASPLPEFTDDMTEQQLSITIPVEFKLTDRR